MTTTAAFIPFSLLLADLGLWSSEIADLGDESLLDEIGVRDTGVVSTSSGTLARFTLVLDRELAIPLFGMQDCAIVLGGGTAGQTELAIEVDLDELVAVRFVDVTAALRFPPAMLKPVVLEGDTFVLDPDRAFSEIVFTASVEIGGQGVRLLGAPTLAFGASMVGDSGVVVEATGIELYFDGANAPPGKPTGWRGVHLSSVRLYLPAELAAIVGDLSLTDAYIGNGGFSGSVATDWTPALSAEIGGMTLELAHAGVTFEQNALVESEIAGSLTVPFFDEPVDVAIGIGLDGSLAIALSSDGGLYEFTRDGLMSVRLDSLGFELEQELFRVVLSGELTPLVGGLDWPSFVVTELSIDSDGNVRLEGGWIDLPSQFVLDFYGFQLEITRIGFGQTDDGGRWVGFSGGVKLVDGLPAGASVEGLRFTWYTDGRPVAITLSGVGVALTIPGVLQFEGAVSYRELPGPVHRFDGALRLALTCISLDIDGQIVVGYDEGNGYAFFAIFLGIELPAGIPLGQTGLGLFGFAGLFGANMEPGKLPDEPWYGLAPGEGWYKRDPIGVAELIKWTNVEGSFAVGGGVTIGTVADNGYLFAGRFLLAIVLPGPIILLEGKANLLKERASLSEDPLLRALMVIDGREGSFLVGIDAHYAYDDAGTVIDIAGGAEIFFPFNDPTAWHLYVGQKEPIERRVQASIFDLFEANAYFMLDARKVAAGMWVGYDEDWKFGPVRIALACWIAGDAVLSFKPLHFTGELWLHGGLDVSVFGFGFGIGADARVTGQVDDPFEILMELALRINLPWPLPDFDIPLTLQWGPEPTPPLLPVPLREVAIEHFLVTTSWPLPRTSTPALLTPNYDPDGDGFLDDPIGTTVPSSAPVVPLDARPHITFSRSVHDDALVGVNPQPPFPASQPSPGWEWIGDPAKNEGPARMRTGLKEIALERRSGTSWVVVARKGTTPNASGVPTLYGSWAPVPQLPGGTSAPGTPPPAGNTKLWLWSKSGFDYTRTTDGRWDRWFSDAYVDYPCIPLPSDERICCDLSGVTEVSSPWSCPDHPDLQLGWTTPPEIVDGRLCFDRGEPVRLRLGRTVKQVELYLESHGDGKQERCLDLRDTKRSSHPNPWRRDGFTLEAFSFDGAPMASIDVTTGSAGGMARAGWRLTIELPVAAGEVEVTLLSHSTGVTVEAYDARGVLVDRVPFPGPQGQPVAVTVASSRRLIRSVAVIAPSDETFLVAVCATLASDGIVVNGVDREGRLGERVAVEGGVATVGGRNLAEVLVRGVGAGFCVVKFCVVVGLSAADRLVLEEMGEHTRREVARWSQEGHVLQPYSEYRLRIVTTVETRDFAGNPSFNTVREQTEHAYFRTTGPPGIAELSVPENMPNPDEFASGLDDLSRYVARTIPASGERPVYRAYDTGVEFGVDYVDLMYWASGRDLGLYLFDNNDRPARDTTDSLLTVANHWGVTEELSLTETDTRWIDLINASTCVTIDTDTITHNRTLGGAGHVLDADARYEARLIPLLLHELFDGYAPGTTASGTGASITGAGGGWRVEDAGTSQGPSRWVVGDGYVEQQSEIWGGSASAGGADKPGTLLVRADDPARPGTDPAQPGNWTDYRLTAIVTPSDDDAIGLAVRYRPAGHYLFTMDRERAYRRLVLVSGTVYTTLAEDGFRFAQGSDYTVSIEAIGDRLRVYQDGTLVFDVTDATHARGGIACYTWRSSQARFADIRVDDLRADAPVAYRYAFVTSRFTDFYHQLHSFQDESWSGTATDLAGAAAAVDPAGMPAAPTDAEVRAYVDLAAQVLGQGALAGTPAVEATVAEFDGSPRAIVLRTAEPIDWARTTLTVTHATPGRMSDAVAAAGIVKITEWTPSGVVANDESVTVLLRDAVDLSGYQLDYRTLPSPAPHAPAGTVLAEPDLADLVAAPPASGSWQAAGGVLTHSGSAASFLPLGDPQWNDVRVRVLVTASTATQLGVALRWNGASDHYRFEMDSNARRLLRVMGGTVAELWSAPGVLAVDEWRELVLEAVGTRVRVLLDDTVLVDLHDTAHAAGSVALGGASGARFASLQVTAAEPSWMEYHTFTGEPVLAAGRRVRLFAGTEADRTQPPRTSEVDRFGGFGALDASARRLPAEGVDLRIVTPEGDTIHATRLHAAYGPSSLRALRAADGTGLILLTPGAAPLAAGRYRLAFTYHRDNRVADPAGPLLREAGDTSPEVAEIDVPVG